jgi:regulatory protein
MRLLSHRERSRRELRTRLASKGYDHTTIDQVLERLQETGLQDDRRFAETFSAGAQRGKGLSAFAIQGELRRRGIDPSLAAEASTETPEHEEERARALAAGRAARMGGQPPETVRRRLEGLLARRGYPSELARRLAAEAAGAMEEDR